MILKKKIFLRSTILREKILKSRFWKKNCTQKITFWFNSPCEMKKKLRFTCSFKNHDFEEIFYSKRQDFQYKLFSEKHDFGWKNFCRKQDFEIEFFRLVRFWINFFATRQILKRNNLPKSTRCIFHIVFLHITMYSYILQYLQLDNSIRQRSSNTSCTFFRKHFHIWFLYVVPLYSQYGLDICRNSLLLVKLIISILQLLLFHTCVTSFWKRLW